jgi:hypothetical protein
MNIICEINSKQIYLGIILLVNIIVVPYIISYYTFLFILIYTIVLSTIIAYNYPKLTIALTVITGQLLQYELSRVIGLNHDDLSFSSISIRLSDPLLFGIITTIIIKSIFGNKAIVHFFRNDGIWLSLFILYVLLQVLRQVFNYGINSFGEFRTYYQFLLFIPYIVISIKKPNDFKEYFILFVILSLSNVITGIIRGGVLYGFKFDAYDKWVSGFGSLALLYGLFGLYLTHKYRVFKISNPIIILISAISISFILISSTRSVWLAGLAGIIFMIIIGRYSLKDTFKLALIFPLLLIILIPAFDFSGIDIYDYFNERAMAFTDYQEDTTAKWRYNFWLATIDQIKNNLLFGVGIGKHFDVYIPEYHQVMTTSPHNFYLTILYHGGVIGLLLYSVVIFKMVYMLLHKLKDNRYGEYIVTMSLVVIIAVHFYGVAYSFEKDFITWMFIGLGLALANINRLYKTNIKTYVSQNISRHSIV